VDKIDELTRRIDERLRAAGASDRAESERRYLKSSIVHYGVTVGQTRLIVRDEVRDGTRNLTVDSGSAVGLAEALWASGPTGPVFERRRAAVEVLDLCSDSLTPDDLQTVEAMIRESGTWALVDKLATDVAGHVALRSPSEVTPILDRWVSDQCFWVR
jgi:3-methyladenine DNA glycosylase AlkD